MRMYDIIETKRDNKDLSKEQIDFFIKEYCNNNVPDYQASALLMAIFINGMNQRETADLTYAMANSGDVFDLSDITGVKVDKHSTGGVGDKTTLIIAPIVASLGIPVAKMSGRGLGHTGGTIDKLESIPMFNTSLSRKEFIFNVNKIKIAVAGQTGNLAPADKLLYALRDVTATVNNISLIASSIMSKKIASGADAIVLDVKTGSGAFMKTEDGAYKLAKEMVSIANNVGKKAIALITDMDVPLGKAIGNSLEVIEAIETLKLRGPKDLTNVSFEIAAKMVQLGLGVDESEALNKVEDSVESGKALEKLKELIEYQGGEKRVLDDYSLFGVSKFVKEIKLESEGYIEKMDTETLGKVAVLLGAGRDTKDSKIDSTAGITLEKKTGDKVVPGDTLARIYTNDKAKLEQAEITLLESLTISSNEVKRKPLIYSTVS